MLSGRKHQPAHLGAGWVLCQQQLANSGVPTGVRIPCPAPLPKALGSAAPGEVGPPRPWQGSDALRRESAPGGPEKGLWTSTRASGGHPTKARCMCLSERHRVSHWPCGSNPSATRKRLLPAPLAGTGLEAGAPRPCHGGAGPPAPSRSGLPGRSPSPLRRDGWQAAYGGR